MSAPTNAEIATTLRRYAAALALQGSNQFKVKAYRRAADTLDTWGESVPELLARGENLTALPGVGTRISGVIHEIAKAGTFSGLTSSLSGLPPETAELIEWPALDAKRVARIYKKLGIKSIRELRHALEAGTIRDLFGARMDFHVRRGLDTRPRMLLRTVERLAEKIEAYLRSIPGVSGVYRAGSTRRCRDTVGDLNVVVVGATANVVFQKFRRFGSVQTYERRSKTEAVFSIATAFSITITWATSRTLGLAMLLKTGSTVHVDRLQARASELGISLTGNTRSPHRIDTSREAPIYDALGLGYIVPELREDRGEIEAAAEGSLPALIRPEDLRGDLHMHTTGSDGANSLEEMVAAAQRRGYAYVAITDHSQSLKIAGGLSERQLLAQTKQIDALNARLHGFTILKSAEVDILEDGRLDYPNAILRRLDITVCSIHSRFDLNRQQQTERILRAMDNPYFTILGHATGRLLLQREGYELDMERILGRARQFGCFLEINCSPNRLDLSDEHALLAKQMGVMIAINTDAHSIEELDLIHCGIQQARRGWLEVPDVLNALPLKRLIKTIQDRKR